MVLIDIPLGVMEDGSIVLNMAPATNISGWSLAFTLAKRFGSTSPFYQAFASSGFNNVSGIQVTDGAGGQFRTALPAYISSGIQASGFDATGNFAVSFRRTDSGAMTQIAAGFLQCYP